MNLTAECVVLVDTPFPSKGEGGEEVSLQNNPRLVYTRVGGAIADQMLAHVFPDHEKISWWCYREAAEVHAHPGVIDGQTCTVLPHR